MNVSLSSADCFRVDASTKPESKDFNLDDIAAPDVTSGLLGVGFGRSWLSRYSLSMEPKELPATGERLLPFMTGNVVIEHLHRYAIAGQFATGRDVLDIASGEGYGSHLLSLNARSVVGVDVSPETVSHARARYERPNLTFREGCCAAIPLPDASVDLVVSFETIEHIQEHTRFLAEVVRVLRKGGQMIISTPEARCDGATKCATNPYHLRELSLAEFEALLRLHFAHVRLYGQRTVHASAILGIDEVGPQKCGVFTGDFHATEFSNKLPRPAYMLAFCSDSPLPGIPVGHFELKGRTANDAFWSEACQIQVFADQGAGYTEALSVRQSLIPEVWQCIRFEHLERLHTDCQRRLRIDLVNQSALIEVAGIRITRDADGAVLYEASSASEFRRLEFSANALTYFEGWALVVLATDADPQLYLPLLPDFHGSACTLEVNLRMNTSVPGLLCRLHQFEGNHRALAAVAEDLRMQVARLKTSETAWKQLHSEDHAKLESTESHARNLEGELSVARSESSELQRALDVARGESAERQRALNAARGESAERQRALETVRNELAAAAAELCGIKSSAEWRLSAPLRWIGSFATRQICSAGKRCAEIREWFARIGMGFSRGYRLRRVRGDCELIRKSGLVGANWYFTRYPAARRGKPDPVIHYVREGVAKGFDPSPLFDTSSYLERNPDVAKAGQNPLAHYLRTGAAEGRDPNPLFDTRWYLEQNPDVASSGENPLAHYARIGAAEGRDPNPLFDSDWYLSQNPDVAAAGCNPLSHYLDCGWREGRDPGPHFDGSDYLKHYLDVAAKGANPLVHFFRYGWSEGRSPGVRFDLHPNSAGDGRAQASEIRRLAEYLNQRAGLGNAASGSVAGRGGDWDLFHKAPKEIGWRKR
ncbi:MAG: class I SAM-dependent methyltransferase, partial [Chthoniobacteraceae bacterium]